MNGLLAFLNSSIASHFFSILSPTMAFEAGQVGRQPVLFDLSSVDASALVSISKIDWDSFETSWDFKRHPLV